MRDHIIPETIVKGLPLYYRCSRILNDAGEKKVSSTELNEAVQVDSTAIRRDFSYFGELEKCGYGYDVEDPMRFFAETLNDNRLTNVTLVSVGNLESVLLRCKFHQSGSIRISCVFGVNEEAVGHIIDDISVYLMEDMSEQIKIQQIEVAILTIPVERAQEVVSQLTETRIKGILNSTAARLSAPSDVLIQDVDLTNGLQTLVCFLHSGADAHPGNTAK